MPPTPSPNKNALIIGAVIAVCVLVGSSYTAYQIGYGRGVGTKTVSQTQNALLTESRLVLGTVGKISGQEVTLTNFRKVPDVTGNPTGQTGSMVVTVDQSTIIDRLVQKDSTTISEEIAAFTEKVQKSQAQGVLSSTTPVTPPEPFTRVEITLNDIKVGDTIAVFAGGDISKSTTFTAARIEIQDAPTTPLAIPKTK